ncbi:MAG: TolC family protein [Chitinophagia bacterium]|nr:TolC family protein [Chitinophagia bacterium]
MKKIWGFIVGLLSVLPIAAQQKLTLTDAINIALKNSLDIQLAQNNVTISTISNDKGFAGGLPIVNATISDNEQVVSISQKFSDPSRDVSRPNVGSNNLTAGVTASMLLYNGSRILATKKRLEEIKGLNQQVLATQIQNTIAAVMTRYYDVVRQQDFLKTIQQSISASQKRIEILNIRKESGLANSADLLQAKIDLNALEQGLQSQQLVIDQTKTDLLNLIFMKPADAAIIIKDTILVDRGIILDSIRRYMPTNPSLLAASQQIKVNEWLEKETAALRYPTLRANTGYNFTSNKSAAGFALLNQSFGPFVGLNLGIPIYNGGVSKKQQQIANINTRNARIQYDNMLLDMETGIVRTYQSYKSNLNQLQTEINNYQLSSELLNLVLNKFALGQSTILDVKQAQVSFENEGFRLVNLSYAAKVAEIELNRIAGKLAP